MTRNDPPSVDADGPPPTPPELPVPELVLRAEAMAATAGFTSSCTRGVGRLLRMLAAAAAGPILEIGTGYGVGAAWLLDGAPPGVPLVSVDVAEGRARRVADGLRVGERAAFVQGSWREALRHGPFALAFVDVGDAKDEGADALIDAMSVGGVMVLDDFAPGPLFEGRLDARWHRWMHHPRLASCEMATAPGAAVLLATRRI